MAAPSPPHSPVAAAAAAAAAATTTDTTASQSQQQQQQAPNLNGGTPTVDGIAHRDISASAAFSDALMNHLLNDASESGINSTAAVASTESNPQRQLGTKDLPLALDSPLRRHDGSLVPGIRLTHAGGWLEGSHPTKQQVAEYTDGFLDRATASGRTGPRQMQRDVEAEAGKALQSLRERMRQRQAAQKQNEQLDKQIRDLEAERAAERIIEDMTRRKRAGGL